MVRPKDPTLQEKLEQWVENNPDRWYTAKYEDISMESGVSASTVYRHYLVAVARAANILPSEVQKKREEHAGVSPWKRKLTPEEIAEIRRLFDEGYTPLDIVFVTGRSLAQIRKYKPKKEEEAEDGESIVD